MYDVKCPYCGSEQEINHDDGYGYEEDEEFEQDCTDCGETFKFSTGICYNYNVECREGDHKLECAGAKWPDMFECKNCDYYEIRR